MNLLSMFLHICGSVLVSVLATTDLFAGQLSPHELPPVAGKPYEEAHAIVERHRKELMQVPRVYYVGLGDKGILVGVVVHTHDQTKKPATFPPEIRALPSEIEGLPLIIEPIYLLPPPSGVIVLRSDGTRREANECSRESKEFVQFGWRFCLEPGVASIPTEMMQPPIAGIPFEEALKILERHREFLMSLPAVESVGMGDGAISVYTANPEAVPSEIEGLPVKTKPPLGPGVLLNHTQTTPVRPLHGGTAIVSGTQGTLTGVALSEGKPWLIFPAHLLSTCGDPSPCPPPDFPLNTCPHNVEIVGAPGTQRLGEVPGTQPPFPLIGFVQRWTPLQPGGFSTDLAAAFMDNNTVEGDASLAANRAQEMWTGQFGFTGIVRNPVSREFVSVITQNLPHVISATVTDVNVNSPNIILSCIAGTLLGGSRSRYFSTSRELLLLLVIVVLRC